MENKINVYELLKDCPKGMELDSPVWNNIVFEEIDGDNIVIFRKSVDAKVYLTQYGEVNSIDGKCVIYPKGKTTWEGFKIPFKDGDIIADDHKNIAIYKGKMWYNCNLADFYCGYRNCDNRFFEKPKKDGHFGLIEELHLATEEEKQKLFDVIKENGYEWNEETKTLEKLIEPKFKVGDRIKGKQRGTYGEIISVYKNKYDVRFGDKGLYLYFSNQDDWELVPNKFDINTLVPFESKVLCRDNNTEKWKSNFWGFYDNDHTMNYPFECCGTSYGQCIPYEGNEHLLGKKDDCDEYFKNW